MLRTEINLTELARLAGQTSISHLARQLGVTRDTIYRWIAGETIPQPRHLLRLGEMMDVTVTVTAKSPQRPAARTISRNGRAAEADKR